MSQVISSFSSFNEDAGLCVWLACKSLVCDDWWLNCLAKYGLIEGKAEMQIKTLYTRTGNMQLFISWCGTRVRSEQHHMLYPYQFVYLWWFALKCIFMCTCTIAFGRACFRKTLSFERRSPLARINCTSCLSLSCKGNRTSTQNVNGGSQLLCARVRLPQACHHERHWRGQVVSAVW